MTRMDKIKEYSRALAQASKWHNSKEAILQVETNANEKKKDEYIYEFYCAMRILDSLSSYYRISITNNHLKNLFPKAPALKKNFPFFILTLKDNEAISFQFCLGTEIIGVCGESSAPDISFQEANSPTINPDHKNVLMIFDAKYKQDSTKIADIEFAKVSYMIRNLSCEIPKKHIKINLFEMNDLIGNSLITNGKAFKCNVDHHSLYYINEVEDFDIGKNFNVIKYI